MAVRIGDAVFALSVVLVGRFAQDASTTLLDVSEVRVDIGDVDNDASGWRHGGLRRGCQCAAGYVEPDPPPSGTDLTMDDATVSFHETARLETEDIDEKVVSLADV